MRIFPAIVVGLGLLVAMPAQSAVYSASAPASGMRPSPDVIQVKAMKKGRPYGWSQGRKVGWQGASVPPGQRKRR